MQWEYRSIMDGNYDALTKQMAPLGADGWELVSVVYDPQQYTFWAFFKRPAPE